MSDLLAELRRYAESETPVALVTVIRPADAAGKKLLVVDKGETQGSIGFGELEGQIVEQALDLLRSGRCGTLVYHGSASEDGELEVFVDAYPQPPTLFIFGGVHIAVALCHLAKDLGFRVHVIDARGKFATPERFPDADQITVSHADDYLKARSLGSNAYVAVLTHDPKLDDPALLHALRSEARYIGAIGSKKTNAARLERLRRAGLSEDQLRRIHGPIGLEIDAETPEEIAVAILAQMISAKNIASPRPAAAAASASAGRGPS